MTKKKDAQSSKGKMPFRFLWSTFCKGILEEGAQRSLYRVLTTLSIKGPKAEVGARFRFDEAGLYAVIAREADSLEHIKEIVTVNIKSGIIEKSREIEIDMAPGVESFQICVNIPYIIVDLPQGETGGIVPVTASYIYNGNTIGSTTLTFRITYDESES